MKKVIKSNAPVYFVGATWLLYALFFPLYRLIDYGIAAALSVAVYFIASRRMRPRVVELPDEMPESTAQVSPVSTGNPDADAMLMQGMEYIRSLQDLNMAIKDEKVSGQIDELVLVCDKIFAFVEEHPEKEKETRVFINYYLPTTIDIINTYRDMDRQSAMGGTTINTTLAKIVSALDTTVQAFKNLLDSLHEDKAMNVSADITVLQNMLERQGLVKKDMSEAAKKLSGTEIPDIGSAKAE